MNTLIESASAVLNEAKKITINTYFDQDQIKDVLKLAKKLKVTVKQSSSKGSDEVEVTATGNKKALIDFLTTPLNIGDYPMDASDVKDQYPELR